MPKAHTLVHTHTHIRTRTHILIAPGEAGPWRPPGWAGAARRGGAWAPAVPPPSGRGALGGESLFLSQAAAAAAHGLNPEGRLAVEMLAVAVDGAAADGRGRGRWASNPFLSLSNGSHLDF